MIGREIVEEERKGSAKAAYGARLLAELSGRLQAEYGNGYSVDNLELFRRFYVGEGEIERSACEIGRRNR